MKFAEHFSMFTPMDVYNRHILINIHLFNVSVFAKSFFILICAHIAFMCTLLTNANKGNYILSIQQINTLFYILSNKAYIMLSYFTLANVLYGYDLYNLHA